MPRPLPPLLLPGERERGENSEELSPALVESSPCESVARKSGGSVLEQKVAWEESVFPSCPFPADAVRSQGSHCVLRAPVPS